MAARRGPNWGPGGCTFCGVRFSEQFVKGSDAILAVCLGYMIIVEIFEYPNYELAECKKPFGIFWIGDFVTIVLFRIFHYLERRFAIASQIARLRDQQARRRKASRCHTFANVVKTLLYLVFVSWTILGTVWFFQDGNCLDKLDQYTDSSFGRNAKQTLALWIFISFCVCILYGIRIVTRRLNPQPVLSPSVLNGLGAGNAHPGVGNFSMFLWTDNQVAGRRNGARRLEDREINALKPVKCTSIEQTRRTKTASPVVTSRSEYDDDIFPPPSSPPLKQAGANEAEKPASGTVVYLDGLDAVDPELPAVVELGALEPAATEASTCAVCLDSIEINEWFKKLPKCQHCFHVACIDEWLSTRATCPVCREEVVISDDLLNNAHPASPNAADPPLEEEYPPPFVRSRPPPEEPQQPRLVLRFVRSAGV